MDDGILMDIYRWQIAFITFSHFFIAWQFLKRRVKKSKAARSMSLIIVIFIVCGIVHATHMFPMTPAMHTVQIIVSTPLLIATAWYIFRGGVVDVADVIDRDSIRLEDIKDATRSQHS